MLNLVCNLRHSLYFKCSGIGIVNAIEVVNAFPEEDGLHVFREWIESPDPTILKKFDAETGSSAKKRGPKVGDGLNCSKSNINEVSASDQNISQAQEQKQFVTDMQDIKQIFMNKHVIVMFPPCLIIIYGRIILRFLYHFQCYSLLSPFNREMSARTGIFLLLFQVKQLSQLTLPLKWTSQLSLSHGESQIILFFASELFLEI